MALSRIVDILELGGKEKTARKGPEIGVLYQELLDLREVAKLKYFVLYEVLQFNLLMMNMKISVDTEQITETAFAYRIISLAATTIEKKSTTLNRNLC